MSLDDTLLHIIMNPAELSGMERVDQIKAAIEEAGFVQVGDPKNLILHDDGKYYEYMTGAEWYEQFNTELFKELDEHDEEGYPSYIDLAAKRASGLSDE